MSRSLRPGCWRAALTRGVTTPSCHLRRRGRRPQRLCVALPAHCDPPFHTWPSTSGLLPANRGECAATSCPVPGPVARAHGGSGGHDDRGTAVPTGRQCSSGCFGVLPRHLTAAAGPAHLDPPVHRPVLPFGDSHVPPTLGCRPTRGPCPAAAPPETRETTVLAPQLRLAAAQSSRRAATSSTG